MGLFESCGILKNLFSPELTYLKPPGVGLLSKGLAVSKQCKKKKLKDLVFDQTVQRKTFVGKSSLSQTIETCAGRIWPSCFIF